MADTKTGLWGASLKGKVVLLVSVAQDLGYELATPLAKQGCRIVLAGRSSQIHTAAHNIKALGLGPEV
jgi:NAD(P)-dependent dehydrogenase (short-subunit alcohol dehydrogenase family)